MEEALSLEADGDWWDKLGLAIVLMARNDYQDPYYRRDVEVFFQHGFERLYGLDGQRVLARLAASA